MFKNNGVKIADRFLECVFCEQLARLRIFRLIHCYRNTKNSEIKEVVDYYRTNKLNAFQRIYPYPFAKNYDYKSIKVFFDGEDYYVKRNGRNLYLGNMFSCIKDAQLYYQRLLIEQDVNSPHRYLTDHFFPDMNDVVLDIGAAEGNLSFDVINNCKKLYLFECDKEWIRALKKTFSDYSDKVVFVNYYVDNYSDGEHISIDDFVKRYNLHGENLFIKIDAEGSETRIIEGAKNTLNNNKTKLAVCTYHNKDDEKNIRRLFEGWRIQHSQGYMFFIYDFNIKFPYLRRGLLRIKK